MPYETYSEFAPSSNTSDLSASLIQTIPNNQSDTGSSFKTFYPGQYDQFVNKTNTNVSQPISITDEDRDVAAVVATGGGGGYLYLHHLPSELNGTTLTTTDTTAAIDTGATDYTNGIIYFTVIPTGDFTVSYVARADAFWANHVNSIQNSIMKIQSLLGAGSITGEGFRNASVWLSDYPASMQSRLPNAVNTEALGTDVALKGDETGAVNITLGNGADTVTIDAAVFNVTSTDAGQRITGSIGDANDDVFVFNGCVSIEATGGGLFPTGNYNGVALSVGNPLQSVWTGAGPGPYPMPYPDTGFYPIAQFLGDVVVVGDVFITGGFTVAATQTGEQVSVISETLAIGIDLRVTGDSYLGTSTDSLVAIGGDTTIGGSLHVQGLENEVSRFDTAIDARNVGNDTNGLGGPFPSEAVEVGTQHYPDLPFWVGKTLRQSPGNFADVTVNKNFTVDGLDPSYFAKLLIYRANDRHDWKNNMVNLGAYSGWAGSVTSVSAPGTSIWTDTGIGWPLTGRVAWSAGWDAAVDNVGQHMGRWYHMGGDYYHGKFGNEVLAITGGEFSGDYQYGEGREWNVLWTNDDTTLGINPGARKYGARVPLKKLTPQYHTGSPWVLTTGTVELSRSFNSTVAVGDTYQLYHPQHTKCDAVRLSDSTTIQVFASQAEPIVGNCNGVHKVLTTPCTHSITNSYTGLHFVYLNCKTPEVAQLYGGYLLDAEPGVTISTEFSQSEDKILLGEFYSTDPGVGIDENSIKTYRYNAEYDTMWMRAMTTGNTHEAVTGEFGGATPIDEFTWRTDTGINVTSNTGTIESPAAYAPQWGDILADNSNEFRVRIQHNIGTMDRVRNAKLKIYAAPNLDISYDEHGSGSSLREGPDYAYIQELETIAHDGTTARPCYEVVHMDRNYTDIVLHELDKIPGAVIGARADDGTRDLVLTGAAGNNTLGWTNGVAERTRFWWWVRCVIS